MTPIGGTKKPPTIRPTDTKKQMTNVSLLNQNDRVPSVLGLRMLKVIIVVLILLVKVGCAELCAQYDKDVFFTRGRMALSDGKYAKAIENFNILAQNRIGQRGTVLEC